MRGRRGRLLAEQDPGEKAVRWKVGGIDRVRLCPQQRRAHPPHQGAQLFQPAAEFGDPGVEQERFARGRDPLRQQSGALGAGQCREISLNHRGWWDNAQPGRTQP